MAHIGYSLSSEEHPPLALIEAARAAEAAGFEFALISDHFHPWTRRQGQSPFVWAVIGGIAATTTRLRLGTGVTCPMIRMHPAIVAQAAATAACMMPGRFFLGVGSGENLNEHVTGAPWPPPAVRLEMLREAIEVIRLLWSGGERSHRGKYFTVDRAELFTLPEEPPELFVAAGRPQSLRLAGKHADGLIGTAPKTENIEAFDAAGGAAKPRYGHVTVCWAPTIAEARRTAHEVWPNAGIPGDLTKELPRPANFEQAARQVTEDVVAESVVCANEAGPHCEAIQQFIDAGYDHVYVHQVGPNQRGFIEFYREHVLPEFR